MKSKLSVFLILAILLGILSFLPVSADDLFEITATDGTVANLTNTSIRKYWNPTREDLSVHIEISEGRTTDGIFICWYTDDSVFTLTARDDNGKKVTSYQNGDKYDGYACFYELDTSTRTIDIEMPVRVNTETGAAVVEYGIAYLKVSDYENPDPDMMKWQSPDEKCDLLVVATHQDDEFIFLGGVIPAYLDQGYSVALAYTSTCARIRVEEGLQGIWESGIRSYPTFIGFPDKGRKETIEEAAEVWGGMEQVVLAFVREIRIRHPEVIVTHDEEGENYHNSHKVTARALEEAVVKAADPAYDPESAELYGAWQVSKLYSHLYKNNQISLNYDLPLSSYGGMTAYEVATAAYAHHESQQEFYQLSWSAILPGGKYDNSLFGCVFSTVGYDQVDLFYGTSVYRGNSDQSPGQTVTTTTDPPPVTSPAVTTMPQPTESTTDSPPETLPATTPDTTPDSGITAPAPNTSGSSTDAAENPPVTSSPTDSTVQSAAPASTGTARTSSNNLQNTRGSSTSTSKILVALAVVVVLIAGILAIVFIQKRWRGY